MDQEIVSPKLDLPGFRFHPTEEELLDFYLRNMVLGKKMHRDVIGYLNIYLHDPSDLPGLSKIGEREWYFLVPRDRKHGAGGGRPNRTTANGFWKATGSDRKIVSLSEPKRVLGFKKTLVFYKGRAPRGTKTDWVMNEYRLPDSWTTLPKVQDIVLCKIYRKATSLKVLEQRAAKEEEIKGDNYHYHHQNQFQSPSTSPLFSMDRLSYRIRLEETQALPLARHMVPKEEIPEDVVVLDKPTNNNESNKGSLPLGKEKLPELQLPNRVNMEWSTQDSCLLTSPWLQTLTPNSFANLLNF